MSRPTVGIFGLTGCAGDQLALLNCERELLELVELLDVRDFLMASSANDETCRLDIALVEGTVLSERDEARLKAIRARADTLVALGTCALHGGIPIMDRGHDRAALLGAVYGSAGEGYDSLAARPLHELVPVDLGIPGCPVEKNELLEAVAFLARGLPPVAHETAVCAECRMREIRCLLDDTDGFCLGPVTRAGCDARCPALGVGCVGCRGPAPDANYPSTLDLFAGRGLSREAVTRKLRTFAWPDMDPGAGPGA